MQGRKRRKKKSDDGKERENIHRHTNQHTASTRKRWKEEKVRRKQKENGWNQKSKRKKRQERKNVNINSTAKQFTLFCCTDFLHHPYPTYQWHIVHPFTQTLSFSTFSPFHPAPDPKELSHVLLFIIHVQITTWKQTHDRVAVVAAGRRLIDPGDDLCVVCCECW